VHCLPDTDMTDRNQADHSQRIVAAITEARSAQQALYISAGGSKRECIGRNCNARILDVSDHSGIIDYQPAELVITARAGTPLPVLIDCLEQQGQVLPFEPPLFGGKATIGGTLACNLSGPARPWSGSVRDAVLGVQLINGKAELLNFGGKVMKNVAGYDISRLIAGSMGTLGILLEASFKVLPGPASELTLNFACDQDEAIIRMNTWAGQPLPISGASWWQGCLQLRLSGAESETARAAGLLQADDAKENPNFWEDLREHHLNFFSQTNELWRLSLPPSAPTVDLDGDCLLDWGGAQRWYQTSLPALEIRKRAVSNGGYATMFRGMADGARFQPMAPALERMQQKIKMAFDPNCLFNVGRMSKAW